MGNIEASNTDDGLFDSDEERQAYEAFCAQQEAAERFQLDRPALICRWRMAKRTVPLLNRHIRALSQRVVNGKPLTTNMLSWAKQHVEWSVCDGSYDDPNGVLMLVIDENGNAAMSVGPYEPLESDGAQTLRERAERSLREQRETGIAPEVLCAVMDGALHLCVPSGASVCGALSLVEQLARTKGIAIERDGDIHALSGALMLVSDEHGVVVASDAPAAEADRQRALFFAKGVATLFV